MVLIPHRRTVATFTSRQQAEQALEQLSGAGFSINQVSLVSKDSQLLEQLEEAIRNKQLAEDLRNNLYRYQGQAGNTPCAMITGSMLGAIVGSLASIGVLTIPGVAPTLAVGSVMTALASTIAGAGIGIAGGGIVSACSNCAAKSIKISRYDSDRRLGEEFLVMVDGTEEELHLAESVLRKW
jgi:hypothetical protein